ncbi:MAG: 4Fe-4S dicluster domain-containing protein [Gemmataceae bacterium]
MIAEMEFFIDPARCIGCQACYHACAECETHKGHSMIHLEYVDRSRSVQTFPVVCMHCHSPTCADVCPADAIKREGDGRVMTARKPRCIACSNCVLACPFGVPKMMTELDLMMKCDMCYDRTSTGRKPMCATVCPSQALYFGPREEVERLRKRSRVVNEFRFGEQVVATKVNMVIPREAPSDVVDVTAAMHEPPTGRTIALNVLNQNGGG